MASAAFINMLFEGGRIASLQVSATEAQECREWALATPSKTVLLDECDARSPLKIISFDSEAAPGGLLRVNPPIPLAEWPTESTVTPPLGSTNVQVDQCRHFVQAALDRDLRQSNAEFYAEITLAWEAVQESIRLDGMPISVNAASERETKGSRRAAEAAVDPWQGYGHGGRAQAAGAHSGAALAVASSAALGRAAGSLLRFRFAVLSVAGWFTLAELFAENDNFLRSADPQLDAVSLHPKDPDEDVVADNDCLIDLTGKDEHFCHAIFGRRGEASPNVRFGTLPPQRPSSPLLSVFA